MIADDLPRHRAMMTTAWLWPCFPFLPLVRPGAAGGQDLGVFVDADYFGLTPAPRVFHANLLLMPWQRDKLLMLPSESFDSFDALLAAGWRVD